jgi:hypothetical protein
MNGACRPKFEREFLTVPVHCSITNLPTPVKPVKVDLPIIQCCAPRDGSRTVCC